jgi:hypothetical protein
MIFIGCIFNFILVIISLLTGVWVITALCSFLLYIGYKALTTNTEVNNTKEIRLTYYNGDLKNEEYVDDDGDDYLQFDRSNWNNN